MAKRSDTKETVLLALELMRRVPRKRKISAKELCDQLADTEVARDLRTIQRQMEMLSEHFDIERDERTKPYGYCWKEQSAGMALPTLSEQESLLLLLAEQHLQSLLPPNLMKSMAGFFTQAHVNLAPYSKVKQEQNREWLKKVRVVSTTQPLLPPTIMPGIFEKVSDALYSNRWLNVDYKNAAGKSTKAEVMPLGLAQQGTRLYLVCRFKDYDDERCLALHRINSANISIRSFERPKDFDLEKFDNDGRFGYGNGKLIRLNFRIEKEAGFHLLESRLSADQTVIEHEDDYEITATVVDTAMLDWWLRGFGNGVKNIHKDDLGIFCHSSAVLSAAN
ncbi:WYL domain-containing protein [Ferrovum sp.]|jgi:predicted DNA-binding transcriptional regulator YafY|uniref:helix-turn-helix transcriptional regulator n=1 Tax=Ferrovum sp. TaxID=2609467 RepID=UPI002614C9FC|nr:WYL domain-containing protein [Ferrovum sp.]